MEETLKESGATLSTCRKYRYALWRVWDPTKDKVMFIGLNPSTADEKTDDATIRRCIDFAKSWGYGGIYMLNLFAFRSKDPSVLWAESSPVSEPGEDKNELALRWFAGKSAKIVFAWGNDGTLHEHCYQVQKMFPEANCFGLTLSGQPKHPLYLPANTQLIPFSVDTPYIKKLEDTK